MALVCTERQALIMALEETGAELVLEEARKEVVQWTPGRRDRRGVVELHDRVGGSRRPNWVMDQVYPQRPMQRALSEVAIQGA